MKPSPSSAYSKDIITDGSSLPQDRPNSCVFVPLFSYRNRCMCINVRIRLDSSSLPDCVRAVLIYCRNHAERTKRQDDDNTRYQTEFCLFRKSSPWLKNQLAVSHQRQSRSSVRHHNHRAVFPLLFRCSAERGF